MIKQINLNVKNPCNENYNAFAKTTKGGFCASCTKEVIDFTAMNNGQVIDYFQNHLSEDTCGRFKQSQLKTDLYTSPSTLSKYLRPVGVAALAIFSFIKVQAQNTLGGPLVKENISNNVFNAVDEKSITVSGQLNDGEFPLPGVNVVLQGTTLGTQTDFDGNFTFPEKLKEGDVLVFSYVGMNSKKVEIQKDSNNLNISLDVNLELEEVIIVGKVSSKKVFRSKKN